MPDKWKFMDRLRAAWRVLWGNAVMYRVEAHGPVKLAVDRDVHVIECRVTCSRVVVEDD